jgi:hypothetical protein
MLHVLLVEFYLAPALDSLGYVPLLHQMQLLSGQLLGKWDMYKISAQQNKKNSSNKPVKENTCMTAAKYLLKRNGAAAVAVAF